MTLSFLQDVIAKRHFVHFVQDAIMHLTFSKFTSSSAILPTREANQSSKKLWLNKSLFKRKKYSKHIHLCWFYICHLGNTSYSSKQKTLKILQPVTMLRLWLRARKEGPPTVWPNGGRICAFKLYEIEACGITLPYWHIFSPRTYMIYIPWDIEYVTWIS